jgi:amino acid transporter
MNFGFGLLMLPFCFGAILFYYLFYKSRTIPRVLSLWGLISVPVVLVATVLAISGFKVPFLLYVPYVPFEWVVGAWILIKGLADSGQPTRVPRRSTAGAVHWAS